MHTKDSHEPLEQRAERLELEYQALLDAAIDAIVVIDQHGAIQLANHAAERLFGYSEPELIGCNVSILMPEPHRSAHDGNLARYLATREPHIIGTTRETVAQRRDGSTFAAELAVGLVKGVEPLRFVGLIKDITLRKRALADLARSESELNAAQDMAGIGNYVMYPDGSGANYRSPQLLRILGLPPQTGFDDIGTARDQYIDSVYPADRSILIAAATLLETEGLAFDITYRIVRPDGSIRQVHHIGQSERDASGSSVRQLGSLHDITDRVQAEDELRHMQERLTHFGRISTMGEMAAGIAHEINQPLAAIATYAQACQRFLAQPNGDVQEIHAGLQQIENQALRAGEVIRRLRSFVRNREVRREALDPNQLLDDSLMLAQTDTRHHGVNIRLERDENLPQVQADPIQIQQVILNLVRNGIDAMLDLPHDRREIILSTRLNTEGDVEVTVSDRGAGLSEAVKSELFNPFFTTKSSGTGLGLAISQSIIRSHGGKLWHRSRSGDGASFCFTLPPAVKAAGL